MADTRAITPTRYAKRETCTSGNATRLKELVEELLLKHLSSLIDQLLMVLIPHK